MHKCRRKLGCICLSLGDPSWCLQRHPGHLYCRQAPFPMGMRIRPHPCPHPCPRVPLGHCFSSSLLSSQAPTSCGLGNAKACRRGWLVLSQVVHCCLCFCGFYLLRAWLGAAAATRCVSAWHALARQLAHRWCMLGFLLPFSAASCFTGPQLVSEVCTTSCRVGLCCFWTACTAFWNPVVPWHALRPYRGSTSNSHSVLPSLDHSST